MDPVIFSRTDCVFHGGAKCQKYREIAEKNGGINKEGKKKGRRGGGKVKPRNLFPVKREQCGLSLVDISGSRAFSPAKFTDVWKISNSRESKTFLRQILYDGGRGKKKKKRKRRYDPEDTKREAKVSTRIENLEKPYGNLSHFCIMRKVGVEYTHLEWKNKVIHSGI